MTTTYDNSKVILSGIYSDVTVTIPAKTTYQEGTILGVDKTSGKITAYESSTCEYPGYVLAQTITNDDNSAVELSMIKVAEDCEVNKDKIIFVNEADTLTYKMALVLNANNIKCVPVLEETTDGIL